MSTVSNLTNVFYLRMILNNSSQSKCSRYASALQRNSCTLSFWCQTKRLYLNMDKCYCMSFYRRRTSVKFDYMTDGIVNRITHISDLGIPFLVILIILFLKHENML